MVLQGPSKCPTHAEALKYLCMDCMTERFAAKVRDLAKSAGLDGANVEGLAGMDVESMRTLGVSGLMGACSGYALKRVGRVGIFSIGAVFASLQLATQYGYLTVNCNKVSHDSGVTVLRVAGSRYREHPASTQAPA